MTRKRSRNAIALTLSASVLLAAAAPGAASAAQSASAGQAASADAATAPAKDQAADAPVDVSITKAKAESLARGYVSIPDDFKLQNVNLSTQGGLATNRSVWSLSFVKTVNGSVKGSINVSVDADNGDLMSYDANIDNPNAKPSYPLKVDRNKARDIALAFIAEHSPKYKDQVRFDEDFGAGEKPPLTGLVRHSLRFDRIVNGIAYPDNFIDVTVDSEGKLLSYNINWTDSLKFSVSKPAFAMDEAAGKLTAAADPQLVYTIPYQMKSPVKPILVYTMDPVSIDASTGEVIPMGSGLLQPAQSPLTAQPLGAKPQAGKGLTKEQAVQAVKDAFVIPADAELSGANYNENQDSVTGSTASSWNLNWQVKDGDKDTGYVYATVNSATGEISNYGSYDYGLQSGQHTAGQQRLSYKDAEDKAVKLVEKQLPWLSDQLYVMEMSQDQIDQLDKNADLTQYSFTFARMIDGARIGSDNVSVSVDAYSGETRSYWASVSDFDYPKQTPEVIGRDKAVGAWLDVYKPELLYTTEMNFMYQGKPISPDKYKLMVASGELKGGDGKVETNVRLVYRLVPKQLDESVALDAQTGVWLNADTGEQTQLTQPKATDIEGHWAQRELELMIAYKALDVVDGKVRPNQAITRGELIKMLVLAINSGRPPVIYNAASTASFADVAKDSGYYPYVENALAQNLIDVGDGSFNPDGKVDRGEMAELIVRALGYNSLAEHDGLFSLTFKDADKTKQKGQAAIAIGLGIMSTSGGNFMPDRQVTRAEAAAAFSRFLSVRASLQEAPLRNG